MTMDKYPVLQSGFISLSKDPFRLPDPSVPTIRDSVIFEAFKSPLQNFFYSDIITELYDSYMANKRQIGNFEFRERVLRAAFEAFETPMVQKWIMAQQDTRVLSALHMRFIIDTIEFVVTGRDRYMQPISWVDLLEYGDTSHSVKVDANAYLKLKNDIDRYKSIPSTFVDLIQQWTTRRNGFEDLLVSLFVIFGRRARQTMQYDARVEKRP